jgi:hypothetical protein
MKRYSLSIAFQWGKEQEWGGEDLIPICYQERCPLRIPEHFEKWNYRLILVDVPSR